MKFEIPTGTPPAKCKGCQATIYWILTQNEKHMPVDPDGEAHWGACPDREQFKRKRK